jgi:serine/tyrosine/threonine adenylyltransferase
MNALRVRSIMAKICKLPISFLPLPPSSQIVTHNLTPDPVTHSPAEFFSDVLPNKPSLQRRARILSGEAHFSYTNPMPLEFPYEITPPDPPTVIQDKAGYIEKWLSEREAIHQSPVNSQLKPSLNKYTSKLRNQKRELIGLSETCLRDCLPHLDVGDAFEVLGKPALAPLIEEEIVPTSSSEAGAIRQELVDVLSGHAVLMAPESSSNVSFAPWSTRYSGHQFGVWAGQLGDGRAISIRQSHIPCLFWAV